MNDTAINETKLADTLRRLHPVVEPDAALIRKVAVMAAARETRNREVQRVRTTLQLAGATAILLTGAFVWPRVALALTLNRMATAMESVRSVRMEAHRIGTDADGTAPEVTYYQEGKWRLESARSIQIWAKNILWTYEPKAKTARFEHKTEGPFAYTPSGFAFPAMLRDYARWGWLRHIDIADLGVHRTGEGRSVHEYSIQQEHERGRTVWQVDTRTALPLSVTLQDQEGTDWHASVRTELHYNEPMAAALFEPKFPADTRIIDTAAAKKNWKTRLSHPLATLRAGERRIALRDLSVNPDGEVFVLYTDGARADGSASGVALELSDDRGTTYLRSERFQPYVWSPDARSRSGFTFGEQRLQGAWFIPLTPPRGSQPHCYTLAFDRKPMMRTVVNTLLSDQPEYAPYMAMYAFLEEERQYERIRQRRRYFEANRDWLTVISLTGEEARAGKTYARAVGSPIAQPDVWLARYKAMKALGRDEEARSALARVKQEDYYNNYAEEIARAEHGQ